MIDLLLVDRTIGDPAWLLALFTPLSTRFNPIVAEAAMTFLPFSCQPCAP
jgi:hypothetical protein